MRIQINNHQWELEGDLQATAWLDLVFEVRTRLGRTGQSRLGTGKQAGPTTQQAAGKDPAAQNHEGQTMRIQIDNHQWELEGDLQATAWLDLVFEVRTRHHEVESIELLKDETNLQGVTFARNKSEIICDGENELDLPDGLWLWFIERFHEAYENIEAIKSGLLEEVAEKAVAASYEMQAA